MHSNGNALGKTLTLAEQVLRLANKKYPSSMFPDEKVRKDCQIYVIKRLTEYLSRLNVTPNAPDPYKVTAWLGMEMHVRYNKFAVNSVVDALHILLIAEGRKIESMLIEKITQLTQMYIPEKFKEIKFYEDRKDKLLNLKRNPNHRPKVEVEEAIEQTNATEHINLSLGPNGLYMVFKVCTETYGVNCITEEERKKHKLPKLS